MTKFHTFLDYWGDYNEENNTEECTQCGLLPYWWEQQNGYRYCSNKPGELILVDKNDSYFSEPEWTEWAIKKIPTLEELLIPED